LTLNDREEISRSLAMGKSLNQIAKDLKRHPSTLSREVARNQEDRDHYRAVLAHRRSQKTARQRRVGKYKILLNPRLSDTILTLLKKRWSPEQIENRLLKEYPLDRTMRICHETIYTYLHILPKGNLKKELLSCLRRGHQRRHKRSFRHAGGEPRDMILIDQRPKDIEDRTVPGHWEGDLIYGKSCQSMLGTLVERKTRFLMLVKLRSKSAREVRTSFARKIKRLPEQLRQTMTYDQGAEMAEHKLFTKNTRMKVYFAHPQSPWERGTNENTNGLLRQFFPRGTDFNKINSRQIRKVEYLLNDRPRKVLDWAKPCEVFAEVLR
jgi:IS30 family transposase